MGEGARKGRPAGSVVQVEGQLEPWGGNTGPEKEKDEVSTTSPSAPSRQLPVTLLKIPGPGHSAPGLEVAQSWGNPGRQVSDASRSGYGWD